MYLFLLTVGFLAFFYTLLKAIISFLRRVLPEAGIMIESVVGYVWVPAILIALIVATLFAGLFE